MCKVFETFIISYYNESVSGFYTLFQFPNYNLLSRGLGAKLYACASASSARNIQYAQLPHSATIENRVSNLRRHAHFNIE